MLMMEQTKPDELLIERLPDGICLLRLNRPQAYNALSRELVTQLRAAVASVAQDTTRVLLLAATQPGFCAGADLKQRKVMSDEEKYVHNRAINALANEIAALPMPTIAVINGVAMGGGCEIALACDMRLAAHEAKIGLTEARMGAMPGAGGSQRLPRLIGTARALELMMTGDVVEAARAAELGLVNAVYDGADLEAQALAVAAKLTSRSRRATALLKDAVYRGMEMPLADALELERKAVVEILASDDYKEGLAAFAEKRPPRFS